MEMSLDLRVSAFACLQPGRPLDRKAGEKGQVHHVASGEPGLFWDCTGGEETRHEGEGRGVAWKGQGLLALTSVCLRCSAPTESHCDPVLSLPDALGLHSDFAPGRLPLYFPRGPLDQVSWGFLS